MHLPSKKQLAGVLIILILFFLIAEATTRFVICYERESALYGYPDGLHIFDTTKGYAYAPNFAGVHPGVHYKNIEIKINSKGLRDFEHSYAKPANATRILALGDSVAFGAGVQLEETYLSLLEQRLENTEIIKAGIDGYDFDQEFIFLKEEGIKYNPDILLLSFVLNDIQPLNLESTREEYLAEPNPIPQICRSCTLVYDALKPKLDLQQHNLNYFNEFLKRYENETYWENAKARMSELVAFCAHHNISLIIAIFPQALQFSHTHNLSKLPQQRMMGFCSEYEVECIDLLTRMQHYELDIFLEDDVVHLSPLGHEVVAQILERFLYHNL